MKQLYITTWKLTSLQTVQLHLLLAMIVNDDCQVWETRNTAHELLLSLQEAPETLEEVK